MYYFISMFRIFSYIGIWLVYFPFSEHLKPLHHLPHNLRQPLKFHCFFSSFLDFLRGIFIRLVDLDTFYHFIYFICPLSSSQHLYPFKSYTKVTLWRLSWGWFFKKISGEERGVILRAAKWGQEYTWLFLDVHLTLLLCWQVSKELIKQKMEWEV